VKKKAGNQNQQGNTGGGGKGGNAGNSFGRGAYRG